MSKVVGVFVDIARMYHAVNLIDKRNRINYERYLQKAVGTDELHRAFAYGIQIKDEAQSFISALQNMGYIPKYKQARMVKVDPLEQENSRLRSEIQSLKNGTENRDERGINEYKPSIRDTSWNVGIAIDVFRNIRNMEHVVIGSNDPELVPLVEFIKEQGIKVTIFSFLIHRDLRAIADHCREVPEDILDVKQGTEVI